MEREYVSKVLIEFSIKSDSYASAMRKSMDMITMVRDQFSSERCIVPTCPQGVWMSKSTPAKLSVQRVCVEEGAT